MGRSMSNEAKVAALIEIETDLELSRVVVARVGSNIVNSNTTASSQIIFVLLHSQFNASHHMASPSGYESKYDSVA